MAPYTNFYKLSLSILTVQRKNVGTRLIKIKNFMR